MGMDDSVYHYTGSTGLAGIIRKTRGYGADAEHRRIFATNCYFLNDSSELTYGVKHVINGRINVTFPMIDERRKRLLVDEISSFGAPEDVSYEVYVACFSTQVDLLSQWSMYGGSFGYALQFNRERLEQAVAEGASGVPVEFADVRYLQPLPDPGQLPRVELPPDLDPAVDPAVRAKVYLNKSYVYGPGGIYKEAVTIKDPAFRAECEFRIIASGYASGEWSNGRHDRQLPPIEFREGRMGLVPYLPLVWDLCKGESPLESVMVGPGPEIESRIKAVKMLLRESGLPGVAVTSSRTPYRP